MAEYAINLEPNIKKQLEGIIEKVQTVKSVRKMNKMLFQCKDLILALKFHDEDMHM
jgi:hypothetical protein